MPIAVIHQRFGNHTFQISPATMEFIILSERTVFECRFRVLGDMRHYLEEQAKKTKRAGSF
jgi:hypothetical protein